MPDRRDPREVRHALAVVLALTACAVLTGATPLPAVDEWSSDAPAHVLEQLGVRPDPLARRRGAHHRTGPGPAGRRREDERDHLLPAAARHRRRPRRNGRHERRDAHSARTRRVPPGPQHS
ncbi:transposase family protein [Kitasatospora sp. NPDC048722]|uniref:transposase family protein n=1 Tax=Kitasatospora sp. NPDC048722 TaxID=3155639 RepID=UPI0033FF2569